MASRTVEPGQPAQYAPLFVGEAPDLSVELKSHPRDECFQMYYGNVVGVLKEDDDGKRTAILADLLGGLERALQRCRRPVRPRFDVRRSVTSRPLDGS